MTKKNIAIISVVAILVIAIVAGALLTSSGGDDKDVTDKSDKGSSVAVGGDTNSDGGNQGGSQDNGQSSNQGSSQGNTQDSSLATQLLGKWRDGANMSGYEFKEGGKAVLTYINLDIPGLETINGGVEGAYILDGDKLTISTSIYTGTITNTYTASVSGNVLTLVSTEDGSVATYMRENAIDTNISTDATEPSESQTQPQPEEPDGADIAGSWNNADGSVKYVFNADGTARFTRNDNEFSGVYIVNGDEVSIQFTSGADKVTEKFEYRVSGNVLTLDGRDGNFNLTRSGTVPSTGTSEDLLGIWSDGANMSGYEFKDAGIVNITYVNITVPVINIPINGTYTGSYAINGDKITINASIYGATISNTYTYSINGNVLTLTADDGSVATYMKK